MAEKHAKSTSKPKAVPKPVHATASPYQRPAVNKLSQAHHDIIVDRFVNSLTPVKAYRTHQPVSKGREGRKRKRRFTVDQEDTQSAESESTRNSEPPPPVLQHLLLGFNHVTRHLEELSTLSAPPHNFADDAASSAAKKAHIAAVFLFHPLDDLIYCHLPALCHTASLAHTERPPTRLVLLDAAAEKLVADAVGLPRLSVLGVVDAKEEGPAEMASLMQYLRDHVQPVDVPWLKDAREGKWMGTRIESR